MTTILVCDDDAAIRTVVAQALRRAGYGVVTADSLTRLDQLLASSTPDVLISDVVLPDGDGIERMREVKSRFPTLPIIILSARNTLTTAVRAADVGAYEYLPKPFDLDVLTRAVAGALARGGGVTEAEAPAEDTALPLIGRSPAMQDVYRVIARVVSNDLTVLVSGESGTGKELVARAIHDLGPRAPAPFVAINMAAIPRDLIEAELFGHERGAFTGAAARTAGRFEQAGGGTLFLDEIGDMPIEAQTRLLRVLQTGFTNLPKATLYGGEFEVQKYFPLDFIDGGFFATRRALVLVNYTYTKSQITADDSCVPNVLGQRVEPCTAAGFGPASKQFRDGAPLTGQSDHLVNVQLGLEDTATLSQVTLLFNYASDRVTNRGPSNLSGVGFQPDIIERPGIRLDLVGRQGFEIAGAKLELKAEARNLTGTRFTESQTFDGGNTVYINRYDLGRIFSLGITAAF